MASPPIEGVSTSIAGFVGPTRSGPTEPGREPVTSLREYERIYGNGSPLESGGGGGPRPNFMWHAARAFFENGGRRLRVARVVRADGKADDGLEAFEDVDDISIVAAPGCTFDYAANPDDADAVIGLLLSHCERMRYRIALIDGGNGQRVADVRAMRAKFDSSRAAFYYPWVRVLDPVTGRELLLPPSGFVAGICARSDEQRGVYKAPANEVVRLALGFETEISQAEQEILNPEGINCFRAFEGRGLRLWGARTMTSDPAWKYVNVRRLFVYLEHSIDRGTQWAVFEPNDPSLWSRIRSSIEDFLYSQWRNGALLGDRPQVAYYVRCDRSTMTQSDLDSGRLICEVGVAPLKPAEFVLFRIGQWTADAKRI